jgi:hypothetical protein
MDGDAGERAAIDVGERGGQRALTAGGDRLGVDGQHERAGEVRPGDGVGLDRARPLDHLGLATAEPRQVTGRQPVDRQRARRVAGAHEVVEHQLEGGRRDGVGARAVAADGPGDGPAGVGRPVVERGRLVAQHHVGSGHAVVDAPDLTVVAEAVAAVPAAVAVDGGHEALPALDGGAGRPWRCEDAGAEDGQRGAQGEGEGRERRAGRGGRELAHGRPSWIGVIGAAGRGLRCLHS